MKFLITIILIGLSNNFVYSQESTWHYPLMAASGMAVKQNAADIGQGISDAQQLNKKSIGKAFLYSLILPGAGEAYMGKTGYTKFFLSVETVIWGLFLANQLNLNWQTKDYQSYAVQHAGVSRNGKDADYWINIGKYNTIYDYNEQKRRDRNVDAIYEETAFYSWYWDSQDNRYYYDLKRIETRELQARTAYFMGAIVLNHLVSAINALRLARKYNKQQTVSWHLDCRYDPMVSRLTFSYSKTF
jgi:hypothetical protein